MRVRGRRHSLVMGSAALVVRAVSFLKATEELAISLSANGMCLKVRGTVSKLPATVATRGVSFSQRTWMRIKGRRHVIVQGNEVPVRAVFFFQRKSDTY